LYCNYHGEESQRESGDTHPALPVPQRGLLQKFEPRLVGAVQASSTTAFADIQLHVFSDSPGCVHAPDGKPMRRAGLQEVAELRTGTAPQSAGHKAGVAKCAASA
jgi:hypothetical protein